MATPTTPGLNAPPQSPQQPQQGAGAPQGPQQGLQAPAPPILQLLGGWHRVCQEISQAYPMIASMMQKIATSTREALTILAKQHVQSQQPQGVPTDQTAQPQPATAGNPPSDY